MTEPQPGLGEPLSAQMYQTLRRGIILGEYPQGSPLKEARLADELAVSRIPIRAAIPHLENEGFLTTAPRRSARVTTWTGRAVTSCSTCGSPSSRWPPGRPRPRCARARAPTP